jgi:hypothetical protein
MDNSRVRSVLIQRPILEGELDHLRGVGVAGKGGQRGIGDNLGSVARNAPFPVIVRTLLKPDNLVVLSTAYILQARANCRWLLRQAASVAFSFARVKAGNSRAAKIAIMAITTSNSIKVNALPRWLIRAFEPGRESARRLRTRGKQLSLRGIIRCQCVIVTTGHITAKAPECKHKYDRLAGDAQRPKSRARAWPHEPSSLATEYGQPPALRSA